ncbi:MAG TPA: alpha/beta fold hydrolase [Candidatus Limnocylindria bacterium]
MNPTTVELKSESETLQADLYGTLPAARAMVLCHGASWDASGWRDIAPQFAERGVPALAINFRGFDGSTGKTGQKPKDQRSTFAVDLWTTVTDVAAAKAWLKNAGAKEIALVGASMGGHAVLGSSFEGDIECVVSLSAPVEAVDDALLRKVTGRKLFICANEDSYGAAPNVLHAFEVCATPKTLLMFGAKEHSMGMLHAPYGKDVLSAMLDFVTGRR